MDVEGAAYVAKVIGKDPDEATGDVHHGHLYTHQLSKSWVKEQSHRVEGKGIVHLVLHAVKLNVDD